MQPWQARSGAWYATCVCNGMATGVGQHDADAPPPSPVSEARVAIWRLFEEGYLDEDGATASLLALDLGTRRRLRQAAGEPGGRQRWVA